MTAQACTVIGIDLGTSYCRIGVWKNDRVEIIPDEQGNLATPSYVAFTDSEILVGEPAKNQIARNPENTIFDSKRMIGRRFSDLDTTDLKSWPFKVVNVDSKPMVQVHFKGELRTFSPEEISAFILSKLKSNAEAHLGYKVTQAVVPVPDFSNYSMRLAIEKACALAGLELLRPLSETSAAVIANHLKIYPTKYEMLTMVINIGGGFLGASLMDIENGLSEVLAIAGDTHFGGQDFDNNMVRYFIREIISKHGKDLSANPRAICRLRKACELAKIELSSSNQASLVIDSLFDDFHFQTSITRTLFEKLNSDLWKFLLTPLEKVLMDSGKSKIDIDEIILIGSSSRIPKIEEMITNFFGGKRPKKMINPAEAVVWGAAALGAIFSRVESSKLDGILCLEAFPRSLGIEIVGGEFTPIMSRNSSIPNKRLGIFSTAYDNQPVVLIQVYEGDSASTSKCKLLDVLELAGIPLAPRGVPRIEITFDVDTNGKLTVSVIEKTTGRRISSVIESSHVNKRATDYPLVRAQDEQKKGESIRFDSGKGEEIGCCCMQ
jgi:heat shock 70kDa protein 1/2/6/8